MDHIKSTLSKESPPVMIKGFLEWSEIMRSQATTVTNLVLNPMIRANPMTICKSIRARINGVLPPRKYAEIPNSDNKLEAGSINMCLGSTPWSV
tara:strand:+ start:1172 stop:1453 length:282 start_codon:yes stop_codon:yes gene_type:complete